MSLYKTRLSKEWFSNQPLIIKESLLTIWPKLTPPFRFKTSLLINALAAKNENRIYRKVFDKITLVMPKNSRRSIKNNPMDDLPPDQQFESFGTDVMTKVKEIRETVFNLPNIIESETAVGGADFEFDLEINDFEEYQKIKVKKKIKIT